MIESIRLAKTGEPTETTPTPEMEEKTPTPPQSGSLAQIKYPDGTAKIAVDEVVYREDSESYWYIVDVGDGDFANYAIAEMIGYHRPPSRRRVYGTMEVCDYDPIPRRPGLIWEDLPTFPYRYVIKKAN